MSAGDPGPEVPELAERRRPVAAARLRPRLVGTFALVAALTAVAVAVPSFLLVRRVTLNRATTEAVRQGRAALEDAVDRLPPAPSPVQVRDLVARLRARGGLEVVAVQPDGSFETSTISLSGASIPEGVRGRVSESRVAWVRTGSGRGARVVVGGQLPDGPSLFLFFPLDDLAADLDVLRNVLAGASGVLVLVSAAIGALAARGLLRPLRQARGAVHRLEVGLYETRLPEEGSDEFADLAHSFNRMAAALERSVADLRALEANHRRFVSDVAHELRTPLTALTTSADVLEAHADGLDDQGRRAAHLLVLESRRLATLVEDLMEISRLDAGVAHMRWEEVELGALVVGAVGMRGWTGKVRVLASGPANTWADRRRLDAVLGNLVGNALEHGSPPVTVTVHSDDRTVAVAVADLGPGIAPEHIAHLFDRFYKADPSRPRSSGSGLGLAIARENARLHGGDVTVVSPATASGARSPGTASGARSPGTASGARSPGTASGARSPGTAGTVFTVVLPRRSAPPEDDEAAPGVAPPLPTGDAAVTTGRLTAMKPRRRRR